MAIAIIRPLQSPSLHSLNQSATHSIWFLKGSFDLECRGRCLQQFATLGLRIVQGEQWNSDGLGYCVGERLVKSVASILTRGDRLHQD
ncbi:hypothetical protein [Iningainema tapete]|uniref:Uncharacterized protein n=1 Tax=Iningainema tapete BLCC-T55 TaxID=2748662 RepID=A0A8J6XRG9_9CYAN|nr:hypothetical protein [Iningainema tapete]MBD2777025.1 hypothetical protein [Iningainema tapete BLCC-T55]